ncbi:MAG: hypothetical protein EP343_20425 [Deltaproteobacteria bacterium]|nr:MAG: hypothetical protein EP343_20425 [Deltaproteobacteria bacterium]
MKACPSSASSSPMASHIWRLLVFLSVSVTMSTGCDRSPDCKQYTNKAVKCLNNTKLQEKPGKDTISIRPMIQSFCQQQLSKSSSQTTMKKKIACVSQTTCEAFLQCQLNAEQEAKTLKKVKELHEHQKTLTKAVTDKQWYKAQALCVKDTLAQSLQKAKLPKAKSLAQTYYSYCLKQLPTWLKYVSLQPTIQEDIQSCFDSNFGHRAKASSEQLEAIQRSCTLVLFAQKYKQVETKKQVFLKRHQFPWQCNPKEAQPLLALKSASAQAWLRRYQKLCYIELGLSYLTNEETKQRKEKSPYCSYYARKVVEGFTKFKLNAPSTAKESLSYFQQLCRSK